MTEDNSESKNGFHEVRKTVRSSQQPGMRTTIMVDTNPSLRSLFHFFPRELSPGPFLVSYPVLFPVSPFFPPFFVPCARFSQLFVSVFSAGKYIVSSRVVISATSAPLCRHRCHPVLLDDGVDVFFVVRVLLDVLPVADVHADSVTSRRPTARVHRTAGRIVASQHRASFLVERQRRSALVRRSYVG